MPKTVNFDDILKEVQQYESYYQKLMSSYSNSTATANTTADSANQ